MYRIIKHTKLDKSTYFIQRKFMLFWIFPIWLYVTYYSHYPDEVNARYEYSRLHLAKKKVEELEAIGKERKDKLKYKRAKVKKEVIT